MASAGKIISFFVLLNIWVIAGRSQTCSSLGQNPSTAFPVCGTNFFTQTSVPVCGGNKIPTPCTSDGVAYSDKNPYWYKFTCYATGTLGFIITPKNLGDDYDWELFDITGRNPGDIFTDASLIVSANWSGSPGSTGASPAGKNPFECASVPNAGISTFSTMPTILIGHDYLLLISHYDGASQSGYDLSYPVGAQGGTASIVNPLVPKMQSARGACNGTDVVVVLNKRVSCTTVAKDGSDFAIAGPSAISVISASANGCTNGFDADTIILKLNKGLSAGSYSVIAKTGTDGNTLTDNCANNLAVGENVSFTFLSALPTPLDSISPIVCATDTLKLVFSKPITCNTIASDGSDFVITGPASVSIKSAKGICTNGVSSVISILLNSPIKVNGKFTIRLVNGSDGNSLIDECGFVTPVGSTLSFTTQNIITADFQNTVKAGCKYDTLSLTHSGNGGANKWTWTMDSIALSSLQNPIHISKAFGNHIVKLVVTNGKCTDSAVSSFVFPDQTAKAAFAAFDTLCPTDNLLFTDLSSSNTIAWNWNFGNGVTSNSKAPSPQSYPITNRFSNYTARLAVQNNLNCADTAYKTITVLISCYIAVPSAFTPNGDGLNDYLYPLNAYKGGNLYFRVYNRFGQVIFETRDWTRKWDGRLNSIPQASGTYVWTLSYTNKDTGQAVFLSGTTVLIR
jgi:gliding motility-associated-like protein